MLTTFAASRTSSEWNRPTRPCAADLKGLLVDYATHVVVELRRGSARAGRALEVLADDVDAIASVTVEDSSARQLIARGALTASKGGRVEDWTGLAAWFDPESGRAQRFALRLVRALPGMRANLRRLHTSTGTATSRTRALALAKHALPAILRPPCSLRRSATIPGASCMATLTMTTWFGCRPGGQVRPLTSRICCG